MLRLVILTQWYQTRIPFEFMDPYIADLKVKGKQLQIMYHGEGSARTNRNATSPDRGRLQSAATTSLPPLSPVCGRVGLRLAGRRMEELAGQQTQCTINKIPDMDAVSAVMKVEAMRKLETHEYKTSLIAPKVRRNIAIVVRQTRVACVPPR